MKGVDVEIILQPRVEDAIKYPNVYLSSGAAGSSVALGGQKMAMPIGTTRDDRGVSLPSLRRSCLRCSSLLSFNKGI